KRPRATCVQEYRSCGGTNSTRGVLPHIWISWIGREECERSVADRAAGAFVDALAQILAWLEVRHVFARQRHGLAGLRIAALARRTEMQRKAAEATDLDATALREGIAHDLQHLLDRQFHILGWQMF